MPNSQSAPRSQRPGRVAMWRNGGGTGRKLQFTSHGGLSPRSWVQSKGRTEAALAMYSTP
jgi:hypothetical protein